MKRLLYISLLTIALLSLATPVCAQEGYPVDNGYLVDEPVNEAIEKQSQGAAEAVADLAVDVPAGGEGPSVVRIVFVLLFFVLALIGVAIVIWMQNDEIVVLTYTILTIACMVACVLLILL